MTDIVSIERDDVQGGGIELVPVEDLNIDASYQRDLDKPRAEKMAANWDDVQSQALIVSRRSSGRLYVIAGQHRLAAAKIAGISALLCIIYDGLSVEQEATYAARDDHARVRLQPVQRHKMYLRAGDPEAIAIQKIVEKHGLRISMSASEHGSFSSITAAQRIYRRGGADALDAAIQFVTKTWPSDRFGLSGQIIEGVSLFFLAFPDVSPVALSEKLQTITSRSLYGISRDLITTEGQNTAVGNVARAVVYVWNKGRRNKHLDYTLINKARFERMAETKRGERSPLVRPSEVQS